MKNDDATVSIITATYNRSAWLAESMATVDTQTHRGWEHLIIGDRCTDDTEAVVAASADPRRTFWNRPTNHGEQAVPNNEAVARATGTHLAFLNHDDLWFPDHLEYGLQLMAATGADMVVAPPLHSLRDRDWMLMPPAPDGRYHPSLNFPASAWLLRRGLADDVGPWESGHVTRGVAPSVRWLWRAHDAGARIVVSDRVTLLKPASGVRAGSYLGEPSPFHREITAALLADPDGLRADLLARARPVSPLRRRRAVRWIHRSRRLRPYLHRNVLRDARRGAVIARLREVRGLPPI